MKSLSISSRGPVISTLSKPSAQAREKNVSSFSWWLFVDTAPLRNIEPSDLKRWWCPLPAKHQTICRDQIQFDVVGITGICVGR
ncbi:hypothetical protein B6169_24540 [Salmonella enterica]|nr:hypothetical protein [Salmonella enterica]EBA7017833.1 hypothetical protein [Salmonella enterica]EDV8733791.1 hypothetical protein [Salmonella enterica subsp. enterica serovar Pomona]